MLAALKDISSNRFARNVGLLASGTIAGQAIMLLALPILTRLFEPEAFGLLGVYMSLTMVLAVAACLRLEIATPLPEADADAINLVMLGILSATLIAAVLALGVMVAPDIIIRLLRQPEMKSYLWLLPVGVWLAALYSALQFWSIRKGRYGRVARTQYGARDCSIDSATLAARSTSFSLDHTQSFTSKSARTKTLPAVLSTGGASKYGGD
jgi:O-antigen/teichoic acid export membrane protein